MAFAKKEAPKPPISSDFRDFLSQGQEDSNPRHLVLETNVLPTELCPYLKQTNVVNDMDYNGGTGICQEKLSVINFRQEIPAG